MHVGDTSLVSAWNFMTLKCAERATEISILELY